MIILATNSFEEFSSAIKLLCCQPESRRRSNPGSTSDPDGSVGSTTSQGRNVNSIFCCLLCMSHSRCGRILCYLNEDDFIAVYQIGYYCAIALYIFIAWFLIKGEFTAKMIRVRMNVKFLLHCILVYPNLAYPNLVCTSAVLLTTICETRLF